MYTDCLSKKNWFNKPRLLKHGRQSIYTQEHAVNDHKYVT